MSECTVCHETQTNGACGKEVDYNPKLTKKVGYKATGILRNGKITFPDANSRCLIAHNPGADDGIDGIELRRLHKRLVNIGALSVVAARASLGSVGCDRNVRAQLGLSRRDQMKVASPESFRGWNVPSRKPVP